jgi:2-keto-3-deoxy-L-rhamnonate aldolase RhmA
VYGTDYYREREPLIVAQIESQEGLRNAPSIIGTPGIDVLFLGSVDLAIDMGLLPERWGESRQCLPDIARIARDAAKFAGCVAGSVEALTAAVEAGCQFISFGDETGFLQSAARARLQQARTALSEEILGDASSRQNDREGDSSLRSE